MPLVIRSLVTAIAWFIPGVLGGFLLALEIHRNGLKLGGRGLAVIALGWGLGFGAGAGTGRVVEELASPLLLSSSDAWRLFAETSPWTIFGIVTGFLAGAIGGWVMVKALDAAHRASS